VKGPRVLTQIGPLLVRLPSAATTEVIPAREPGPIDLKRRDLRVRRRAVVAG